MEYCPECGAKLDDGDSFCSDCGAAIGDSDPSGKQQTNVVRAAFSVGLTVSAVVTAFLIIFWLINETAAGWLPVTILTWAIPGGIVAALASLPFIYIMR